MAGCSSIKFRPLRFAAVALAATLAAAPGFAQNPPPAPPRNAPQAPPPQQPPPHTPGSPVTIEGATETTFALGAAHGDLAEVQLGKLAQTRADSDQVKQFAGRMVADHTKALDQLKNVAANIQLQLPHALDAKHHALEQKLSSLRGHAFDVAYMNAMLDDHMLTVGSFREEADHGRNANLKAYAAATLPTLEQHLQMAKQIDAALKSSER